MKKRSSLLAITGVPRTASAATAGQIDRRARPGQLATMVLEIDHPELAVLIHERQAAGEFAERLTGLHVSLAASGPDLAISVWLRFRELIAHASNRSHTDQLLVRSQLAFPGHRDPDPCEPIPESLRGNSAALEALGRWRACVHLVIAAGCHSTGSATPSRVLKITRDSATAHVADLDATIRRLAKALILDRDDIEEDIRLEAIFVRAEGGRVAIRAVASRPN